MVDKLSALVIAKPGQWRESLRVLLLGIAKIGTVSVADAGLASREMSAERQPALVLLDFESGNEILPGTLQGIKISWPATLCIVLVENEEERRTAANSGGDLMLLKGLLAARLAGAIEEALSQQTR